MDSPPSTPVLVVERLTLRWPDGAPQFVDLDLRVRAGVTLLHGDSGSGKTTLLRLVAGELQTSARIALDGRTLHDDPAAWKRAVAFVDAGDETLDALDPGAVMARVRERHGVLDEPAWRRHVDAFGLLPHVSKAMFQLSTGSRRKVVLAALLAVRCPLVLLDEPGAGLDAASLRHLRAALAEANGDASRALLVVAGAGLDGLDGNATVTLPAADQRLIHRADRAVVVHGRS